MERPTARAMFEKIILVTHAEYGVDWEQMVSDDRGAPEVAAARVMAMAVSCSAGIPLFLVAKMFKRCWSTVDTARATVLAKCNHSDAERDKFIRILYKSLGR